MEVSLRRGGPRRRYTPHVLEFAFTGPLVLVGAAAGAIAVLAAFKLYKGRV